MNSGDINLARKDIAISNLGDAADYKNETEPLAFTVLTDNLGIVPGLRGLSIPPGEKINLPVIIPHITPGDYSGNLIIKTSACGERVIKINAKAK